MINIDSVRKWNVNFDKMGGLVPVVVQDNHNLQVLMVGFMNEEALDLTLSSMKVTFFSRTKNRVWQKGETSGNFLHVVEMFLDCDDDSILIMANPIKPTCHTGSDSCFKEQKLHPVSVIGELDRIILDRINYPKVGSYTNKLLDGKLNKIAQKVGEEAVEVVIASLNETKEEFVGEVSDLLYHLLVLVHAKQLNLSDVSQVIKSRFSYEAK